MYIINNIIIIKIHNYGILTYHLNFCKIKIIYYYSYFFISSHQRSELLLTVKLNFLKCFGPM